MLDEVRHPSAVGDRQIDGLESALCHAGEEGRFIGTTAELPDEVARIGDDRRRQQSTSSKIQHSAAVAAEPG